MLQHLALGDDQVRQIGVADPAKLRADDQSRRILCSFGGTVEHVTEPPQRLFGFDVQALRGSTVVTGRSLVR
jgi:hypothetical protein